jgi:hypothetical protein
MLVVIALKGLENRFAIVDAALQTGGAPLTETGVREELRKRGRSEAEIDALIERARRTQKSPA